MRKIFFFLLSLCATLAYSRDKDSPYITEENCAYDTGGNSYLDEAYENGGATFFSEASIKTDLENDLSGFNSENTCALQVYCGRFFLSYEQIWNWDTTLYSYWMELLMPINTIFGMRKIVLKFSLKTELSDIRMVNRHNG
ncbi:MAG: hypothetical protein HY064_07350 [Bacteroidetes bacterium]|nr:hypothetical protein [Bacteroidota bacterium]